jgi:hypothetical protein
MALSSMHTSKYTIPSAILLIRACPGRSIKWFLLGLLFAVWSSGILTPQDEAKMNAAAPAPDGDSVAQDQTQGPDRTCVMCGKVIPVAAKLCSNCDSYQDRWRRLIGGTADAFASLASALPLLAIGLAAWRLVFPPPADLQFSELTCSGGVLQMSVSNVGETIGAIEGVSFSVVREPAVADQSSDARTVFTDSPIAPLKPNDVTVLAYHGKLDDKPTPFPSRGPSSVCTYQLMTTSSAMVHTITGSKAEHKVQTHECRCAE